MSMHRTQIAAHRATIVGRDLTQLGNVFHRDLCCVDGDADGLQSGKAAPSEAAGSLISVNARIPFPELD